MLNGMPKRLLIIWPEQRWLSPRQIDSMYSNAKASGVLISDDGSATDPWDQLSALHDAGVVTAADKEEV